jgi:2',3'-cyclic-nucleotide 2'-phosphodiesterase (5'-nucleotidase family)
VTNSTAAVNAEAAKLKAKNIGVIVAIGHLGATSGTLSNPAGPLIDLADNVANVDAVIGDHTDFQVIATRANGVLVTENRSKGIRFTRLRLAVNPATQTVVYKTADFHRPWNIGITPDPDIQARIDQLNAQLAPIFGTVIGDSNVEIPRSDSCGNPSGRRCESNVGDVVTDAMRKTYVTDFAITNSGGLRDQLTCSPAGGGSGFCPTFTPPPWKITRGQVLAVLPFGNVVSTVSLSGVELKTFLENGVSFFGNSALGDGRFPQVSGLCFSYNINAPAGSRVVSAVRQNADGTCSATPIDLGPAASYTLAINDFMASGGDGYPNVAARATTRNVMDQDVADFISANTPINAAIQGRITCTGTGCPVPTP